MAEDMIEEIVNFVGQHQESTASLSVYRRILGSHPSHINQETLSELRRGLAEADPEEVESCYYIIK